MNFEFRIEPTANGYSAYVPDLPGCVAAAETREETEQLIRESIDFHLEGLMLGTAIVSLSEIKVVASEFVVWTTDNTPTLYVKIVSPQSSAYVSVPPQIAFGAAGATA